MHSYWSDNDYYYYDDDDDEEHSSSSSSDSILEILSPVAEERERDLEEGVWVLLGGLAES